MKVRHTISITSLVVLLGSAPGASGAEAEVRRPIAATSLSREAFAKLGPDEPIEYKGQITSKAKLLAPLGNARAETEAALKMKLAETTRKLDQLKTKSATLHRQRVAQSKGQFTTELAKLKQLFPPVPKATPTPCAGPVVSGVIGLVTPDSDVLVLGHCFGTQQGSATLQGAFSGGPINLPIIEWHDGGIGLHIPATISGANDQFGYDGAQIVVQTAQGQRPPVPPRVDFSAARETRILEAHDVSIVCSNKADINNCDPNPGRALDASHSNTFDITQDSGVDKIMGSLKNGWVLVDQSVTEKEIGNIFEGSSVIVPSLPSPSSTFSLLYSWEVAPFEYFRYVVVLYAEGPVGTNPH